MLESADRAQRRRYRCVRRRTAGEDIREPSAGALTLWRILNKMVGEENLNALIDE